MLHLFRKYAAFKILEYFLNHPTEEIHLKEMARKLEMSPRSIKIYCDEFEMEGIIKCRRQGNLRLFSLNNENYVVKEIKRAYVAILLKEFGIDKISENAISIAVYGSHAFPERLCGKKPCLFDNCIKISLQRRYRIYGISRCLR